jgi:hypothetical protein
MPDDEFFLYATLYLDRVLREIHKMACHGCKEKRKNGVKFSWSWIEYAMAQELCDAWSGEHNSKRKQQ